MNSRNICEKLVCAVSIIYVYDVLPFYDHVAFVNCNCAEGSEKFAIL